MTKKLLYRLIIIIISLNIWINGYGQFYNGLQMSFGKNRVQYYDFYWSFFRFENFDCYFNEYGRDLAAYTASYADKRLAELEDYFDYKLEKRLIFIIYNKQAEFKQTNIGLVTGNEDYNIGGYSRIIENKVSLYYEGDHVAFDKQISASIVEALINEMFNDADIKDKTSSSSSIEFPEWYMKGLVNYVAFGWDFNTEDRVKDGFKSGRYKNLSHLENEEAIFAGQSFWRFIAKSYGDALIPNIIYLTKVYKNVDDGFQYVLGLDLKDLSKEWISYYNTYFERDGGSLPGKETLIRKGKKDQIIQQVKISPDKKYIAYSTNDMGRRRIWLYDTETGKKDKIFAIEPKFDQKIDNTYPVMAWHPTGRILTFINEEKNGLVMYFYRITEKSFEKRNLLYFDKVLDLSYSPEGSRLVFSAVKDGITDIYIHTIASGTNDQITRDVPDDLNPSFLKGSADQIIFSSNRLTDTLFNDADPFEKKATTFDLFTYDLGKRPEVLVRLTEGMYINRFNATANGKNSLVYVGNNNGIFNRYLAKFDSIISNIDTISHYRYFISSKPVTNYPQNIINQDIASNTDTYGEIYYNGGRYNLSSGKIGESDPVQEKDIIVTSYMKEYKRNLQKADSIDQIRKWLLETERKRRDTLTKPLYEYYAKDEPIDYNHYIFEKEKENYYEQLWRKDYMDIDLDTGKLKLPLIRIYETSFYNNYIASQIDFSFLTNSYQAYNGGAPYFNPGLNLLTKIGTVDLFEDYKITGGFRFAGNFDSNEYLLSAENLKGKFDKLLVFHRQVFNSSNDTSLYKIHTQNMYLTYSKPINPVLSLKGTFSYRYDRYVTLSTDIASLNKKILTRHWAGLKGEIVFDNTRKRLINIYYGTRAKLFGEYYREVKKNRSDMFVLGLDVRNYTKIHRELIWANRFAASTSFGPTKLLYYLGGVDNWMGYLFNKVAMFDNTIPVDPTQNYGFQAIATNLRGFSQNIRNGNSFAVINSEIRWPFVRYLAGHPLRSNLLNSLQIIAFGDIGTAWTGPNPWAGKNSYDNEVIKNGPVVVTLDTNKEPIVGGFGGGLRAQLAGYFIRADLAWGVENKYILPKIFYLSFSLDF